MRARRTFDSTVTRFGTINASRIMGAAGAFYQLEMAPKSYGCPELLIVTLRVLINIIYSV